MANINKIKLSGTTYNIQDENATKTVELTQAQYDALTVKDPNTFYVITDAQGADLSSYYTKTETDDLLDTKLDVSAYTPTDLSNYYTKSETSGATEISTALNAKADTATTYTKTETDNAITAATSTKQDTLVSGTNIKTINNESILGSGNITIEGGGGGSSYTAGDGIDITNDVISVTGKVDTSTYNTYTAATDTALASKQTTLTAGTGIDITDNVISATGGGGKAVSAGTNISITTGETADTINCTVPYTGAPYYSIAYGYSVTNKSQHSLVIGAFCSTTSSTQNNIVVGYNCHSIKGHNATFGFCNYSKNEGELSSGCYNVSNSGSTDADKTLFSVGNGTSFSASHNAFEVRKNGDIYITKDGQDVKLQDQLGGTVDTEITSASTNPVTSAAIYNQFGGLKLVKLSQSAYDSLATKDSMTLYIIEEAPECNTPQGATYHTVDDNFDKTTQVYGIDFSNYDVYNNEPTTFTVDLKNANNIEYTVDVNTNNVEPYYTTTVTRGSETVYTADVASFNFCEVFGEPMYISTNATIPSYETCVNSECIEYDCLQWDEETGECIEQGDCINTECLETQTNYPMTALY